MGVLPKFQALPRAAALSMVTLGRINEGLARSPSRRLHGSSVPLLGSRKDNVPHAPADIYATNSFGEFIHFPDVISEQQFKVPSFGGSVWVKSPWNVRLKPAGTFDYPNLDQAFVRLLSRAPDADDAGLDVKQDGPKLSVTGRGDATKTKGFLADIEAPIVHSVNADAVGEACIDVHDFTESGSVNLTAESGRIGLHRIKTGSLTVQSESGHVMCSGQLHGNVKITCGGSGNIICEKRFAGPSVELETEDGDIRVASSYSEQAKFSTTRGNMHLRNIHNESYVAIYERGDLKILGIDGSSSIFVKKGDVEAQVSRVTHESRIYVEEGDIYLKVSDAFPLKVSVDANDVIPDAKFRTYGKADKKEGSDYVHYFAAIQPNKFSPTLVVVAENGTVVLDSQDWAASLGLKLNAVANGDLLVHPGP